MGTGKKGIYFREKRQNVKGKGEQRQYCIYVPLFSQGNKGTGTPWECTGSKGKFGFFHANSEGSGESAHLSLA